MTSSTRTVDWKGRRWSTSGSKVSYAEVPMVTVLSKNMKILKLWRSIVLLNFQKKTRVIWNLVFKGSYDNIGIVLRTGFYVREL